MKFFSHTKKSAKGFVLSIECHSFHVFFDN